MNNAEASRLLSERLALETAPVALAFMDAPPPGVETNEAVVPSACAMWREAEKRLFFAPADRHFNCPIGAMVMGFDLPQAISDELTGLVGAMTDCGYIGAEEPGRIPSDKRGAKGILYGPLADFPAAPDAVLAWLTPAQAMIWSEAAGGAEWGGKAPMTVLGRPGCAAIPAALGEGRSALSFGCIGMRTFTGVAADRMLAVLPGSELECMAEAVSGTRSINDRMENFYKSRLADLHA